MSGSLEGLGGGSRAGDPSFGLEGVGIWEQGFVVMDCVEGHADVVALGDEFVVEDDSSWADFAPEGSCDWRGHSHCFVDACAEIMALG